MFLSCSAHFSISAFISTFIKKIRRSSANTITILLTIITLASCSSKPPILPSDAELEQSIDKRNQQLKQLTQWKITGKIAFIQNKKRESASLVWQVDTEKQTQKLNLNSYLGINILHLESKNGLHLIKVDGEKHTSSNLEQLIYSLTGLTLPANALNYWLKGLPYLPSDKIAYNDQTHLPETLTSFYNFSTWQIHYDRYQLIKEHRLATSFTLKKDDLLIKIAIKKWHLPTTKD